MVALSNFLFSFFIQNSGFRSKNGSVGGDLKGFFPERIPKKLVVASFMDIWIEQTEGILALVSN
jgi:hypothetical protein